MWGAPDSRLRQVIRGAVRPSSQGTHRLRIRPLFLGNPGDVKPVGEGVSELRVDYGPGYRVYFVRRGNEFVVLLTGGDKSSQDRDIRRAKDLAREL